MTERVWDRYVSKRDQEVCAAAGYDTRAGFGKRPALLIIDVNYHFCGDKPEPILKSIERWPNSCGEDAWTSIKHIQQLISAARAKRLPIIYTTAAFRDDAWNAGSWAWKSSRVNDSAAGPPQRSNLDGNEIVAEIAPAAQDLVVIKIKPSAFHGTPLTSYLHLLEVDSLFVCGTTTSGCVRASVVDAFSENYRVTIAEEGCFDRFVISHAVNLMDMNAKYADVVSTAEIVAHCKTLPDNLFELPKGRTE